MPAACPLLRHEPFGLTGGFARTITLDDDVTYELPTAEHDLSADFTPGQVLDKAKAASGHVSKAQRILVTESKGQTDLPKGDWTKPSETGLPAEPAARGILDALGRGIVLGSLGPEVLVCGSDDR